MSRPHVPVSFADEREHRRQIADAVNALLQARNDPPAGQVTLTASQTTTVVFDTNCLVNSRVFLVPRTSSAAAEQVFVANVAVGSFTLSHANSATTDRIFDFLIV